MICCLVKIFLIFRLTQIRCTQIDCSTTNFLMKPIPLSPDCLNIGKPGCKDLNLIPLTKEKIQQYELAHNGIRSRVAKRFMIGTMLQIYWDPKLYQMAKKWITTCKRSIDPCAQHSFDHENETTPVNKLIGQNTAFVDTQYSYVPYNFETTQFTKWYYEGNNITNLHKLKNKPLYFLEHNSNTNNFSTMANPNVYRFGCAAATFKRSYAVVCNYLFNPIRKSFFRRGLPGTKCEDEFPVRSPIFRRLCTAYILTSASLKLSTHLYAFIIMLLLIL